ncbi:alpha/beta hydrolase [Serratia sp. L9]|uniref:alpha/beta hydrolase n=1 Tax=Serratia sp. L9 TaxID=3423946 RepID=UPI003D66B8BD
MKTNVYFKSNGLNIAAHLYTPESLNTEKYPAIIVGHPGSGVKEQTSGLYAARLAQAGFVTLAFDAAYQGESEGEPRGLEEPAQRVEDFKAAVSFLSTIECVAIDRIGALGICASGGYVVTAAVGDHRIKATATVSGVDLGSIYREGPDGKQDPAVFQSMLDAAAAARTAEAQGEAVQYFPLFPRSKEEAAQSGVFMSEGYDYYCTPRAQHPRSAKELTWSSVDRIASFDGFQFAHLLASRPLLVIIGQNAITTANSSRAFDNAQEPKEIFWVEGASHQDLYDREPFISTAATRLTDFFSSCL